MQCGVLLNYMYISRGSMQFFKFLRKIVWFVQVIPKINSANMCINWTKHSYVRKCVWVHIPQNRSD